jgi:hypothetical protein
VGTLSTDCEHLSPKARAKATAAAMRRARWGITIAFVVVISTLLITFFATERTKTMSVTNMHHVLHSPLIVYSGGPQSHIGILPTGTSLRYVESFPEGFDRFVAFVNVERSPLALEEIAPPGLVDPLSARPGETTPGEQPTVTIEELQRVLHSLGVRRSDLNRLLESYK